MIHDKDYIIRIVKQFSEFLGKMILGGKNDGDSTELQRIFDTNMNDTFKMTFEKLAEKTRRKSLDSSKRKSPHTKLLFTNFLGTFFTLNLRKRKRPVLLKSQLYFMNCSFKRAVSFLCRLFRGSAN